MKQSEAHGDVQYVQLGKYISSLLWEMLQGFRTKSMNQSRQGQGHQDYNYNLSQNEFEAERTFPNSS